MYCIRKTVGGVTQEVHCNSWDELQVLLISMDAINPPIKAEEDKERYSTLCNDPTCPCPDSQETKSLEAEKKQPDPSPFCTEGKKYTEGREYFFYRLPESCKKEILSHPNLKYLTVKTLDGKHLTFWSLVVPPKYDSISQDWISGNVIARFRGHTPLIFKEDD